MDDCSNLNAAQADDEAAHRRTLLLPVSRLQVKYVQLRLFNNDLMSTGIKDGSNE